MNTVIYKAVKHLDYYYLVEDPYNKYPEGIGITEAQYSYFLKRNQDYGHMIRMSKGELVSCEVPAPTDHHTWDETTGEWFIEQDVQEALHKAELEDRLAYLKQELLIANLRGKDITKLVEELDKVEQELGGIR